MAEQGLHHVKIGPSPDPAGGRRVPEHVGPHRETALPGQPLEEPLRRAVGHRRAQGLVVEVDEHHVAAVLAEDLRPLVLVVGVASQHRVAGGHGPGKRRLGQRAVRVSPVPHMNVGTQHRASHAAGVGKQVQVRPAQPEGLPDPQPAVTQQRHHEAFPGPLAARHDLFGLFRGERLRERRLRPRLEHPGPHPPELAGLPGIETGRGEPQPAGLGQLAGDGLLDHPGPGAEPQELAHRGERGVDRRARTHPPAPARGGFHEMLKAGQARQADRGPLNTLARAPPQEARHPSGIDPDRVGRTARPMQRPQEVTGLPVRDELRIQDDPQLGSIEGGNCPFSTE